MARDARWGECDRRSAHWPVASMILYSVVEAISPTGSSGVLPTGASSGRPTVAQRRVARLLEPTSLARDGSNPIADAPDGLQKTWLSAVQLVA